MTPRRPLLALTKLGKNRVKVKLERVAGTSQDMRGVAIGRIIVAKCW